MAKNLFPALFLAIFGYSVWIYANRDEKSLKSNLQNGGGEDSKFLAKDLLIRRYKEAKLETKIQVGTARFVEPNLLEISAGIRVEKIAENKTKTMVAENALASFETTPSKGLITSGDLVSAKLNRNVGIDFSGYRLLTASAEYLAREDEIVSDQPVTVHGDRTWFQGKSGFRVELADEIVEIYGKANGEAFVK